jgi:hypothetical protein
MPDLAHWTIFLGAAFILLITPGPSIMYVVARGIAQGCRAAVLSSVGLALGDLLQVIATAVGLAALLGSAPKLFVALKLVGALYLVCLGAATLLGKGGPGRGQRHRTRLAASRFIEMADSPGTSGTESQDSAVLLGLSSPVHCRGRWTGANSSAVIWDGVRRDGPCHELTVRLFRREARGAGWERGKAPNGDAVCRW